MEKRGLKLKQATAILQIQPKELQNLVQFGVVKAQAVRGDVLLRYEYSPGRQGRVLPKGISWHPYQCAFQAHRCRRDLESARHASLLTQGR